MFWTPSVRTVLIIHLNGGSGGFRLEQLFPERREKKAMTTPLLGRTQETYSTERKPGAFGRRIEKVQKSKIEYKIYDV